MADGFLALLSSRRGLSGIGPFGAAFREINCLQGRPDFIAFRGKASTTRSMTLESIGLAGAAVLALLKSRSPRSLDYLLRLSGYSPITTRKAVDILETHQFVRETKRGCYVLGRSARPFDWETWAFELKLNDPRRAIFQAKQTKTFADRVIIVVPPSQLRNYNRFSEAIVRWGIGLAGFDPCTQEFYLERKPRKTRPLSRQHRIYAIAQILAAR
jgi:hypothetical protein